MEDDGDNRNGVPMPTSDRGQANRLVGLAFAALAPIVVSLILVPFRDELDNANLALILVFVVVIAAIVGGRAAGALAAVMATLSFDFFLTRPLPLDEDRDQGRHRDRAHPARSRAAGRRDGESRAPIATRA